MVDKKSFYTILINLFYSIKNVIISIVNISKYFCVIINCPYLSIEWNWLCSSTSLSSMCTNFNISYPSVAWHRISQAALHRRRFCSSASTYEINITMYQQTFKRTCLNTTFFQSSSTDLLLTIFLIMKACIGANTAQGPPSNWTRAVGSSSLKQNPANDHLGDRSTNRLRRLTLGPSFEYILSYLLTPSKFYDFFQLFVWSHKWLLSHCHNNCCVHGKVMSKL